MNINFADIDRDHYASNLRQDGDLLNWDAKGSSHYLIIISKFGEKVAINDELKADITNFIEGLVTSEGIQNENYGDKYEFLLIPTMPARSFNIRKKPAEYAIFCANYNREDDVLTLYVRSNIKYRCSVSSKISISMREEIKTSRAFLRKKITRVYYVVTFPEISGYIDNTLYYKYNDYEYSFPITSKMLGKQVSIPAYNENPPIIESNNKEAYTINMI